MALKNQLILTALCLTVTGCAGNDMVVKKQTEIEARLEQVLQSTATETARNDRLTNELRDLQAATSANAAGMEELKRQVQDLTATVEALLTQGKVTSTTSAFSPTIEVVNREASPAEKNSGQEAYLKAFGIFSANNYDGAISAFQQYLQNYPKGEYAGNAQYWIGECYYTQKDYRKAIEAFTRVMSDYPKGSKVPDALLKVGFSLISLNEMEKARATLKTLVEKYPKSQAADKARERLDRH